MDMTGTYRIPAPRETVWAALNDPDVLRACIPGCESLEMTSPTEMTATVTTKIGPVKARFTGKVTLSNVNPPEGYTISGEGNGGAAGFAKGGADVRLTEEGTDTVLTYEAHAQVGGKLAQMGARLVDGVARKMADQFFADFARRVGGPPVVADAPALAEDDHTLADMTDPVVAAAEPPGAMAPMHTPAVPDEQAGAQIWTSKTLIIGIAALAALALIYMVTG